MGDQKFIATWTEDKRFFRDGIVVLVKRSNHHRPRYSYEVMVEWNEKLSRHFFVRCEGEGKGQIQILGRSDSIGLAIQDAERYIKDMYQAQEDAAMTLRIEKENREVNRDKPKQRPGLKQLGKQRG